MSACVLSVLRVCRGCAYSDEHFLTGRGENGIPLLLPLSNFKRMKLTEKTVRPKLSPLYKTT